MPIKYLSLLLVLFMSTLAYSQQCPIIKTPSILNPQDISSISQLKQNFTRYDPDVRLRPERNRLLMNFAFANQQYVIDTFYSKYCVLIGEQRFQLGTKEQSVKLSKAQIELYFKVPFAPPVIDSRVNISQAPVIKPRVEQNMFTYASYSYATKGEPLPVDPNAPVSIDASSMEETPWLKEPPYVVTQANKYFVIVSSVLTYEQAVKEVKRLKRRASELDYVVYGPYQNNPYHAIMVGTWLSKAEADIVLAQTKTTLNMDARLWWCPNEGEVC